MASVSCFHIILMTKVALSCSVCLIDFTGDVGIAGESGVLPLEFPEVNSDVGDCLILESPELPIFCTDSPKPGDSTPLTVDAVNDVGSEDENVFEAIVVGLCENWEVVRGHPPSGGTLAPVVEVEAVAFMPVEASTPCKDVVAAAGGTVPPTIIVCFFAAAGFTNSPAVAVDVVAVPSVGVLPIIGRTAAPRVDVDTDATLL